MLELSPYAKNKNDSMAVGSQVVWLQSHIVIVSHTASIKWFNIELERP